MLDLPHVRSCFPALSDEWALFDNAGGTVPLGAVVDRVATYMRECMVQVGASYAQSARAQAAVQAGHRAAKEVMNAEVDEVVLGPFATGTSAPFPRFVPLIALGVAALYIGRGLLGVLFGAPDSSDDPFSVPSASLGPGPFAAAVGIAASMATVLAPSNKGAT